MYELKYKCYDDRVHGQFGKIHFAFAGFTFCDQLEELEELVQSLTNTGMLVSTLADQGEAINGFRIKKPAQLRIVPDRNPKNKRALVLVHTGGYDGSGELLDDIIRQAGLITGYIELGRIENVLPKLEEGLISIHRAADYIKDKGEVDFSRSWGSLVYSSFLHHCLNVRVEDASAVSGRKFRLPLKRLIVDFKRVNQIQG